jgi:CcmD family protein
MSTSPMNYLFAAYVAIWIILAAYLYSIHSRERKLRDEIERLKQLIEPRDSVPR